MNKLGYGFLRLPFLEGEVDYRKLNMLVDAFLANGGKYFDTAYTYLDGKSEEAIRRSVAERYPRDRFLVADKLPGYLVKSPEESRVYFQKQLSRCGVDFFDVYMLHWLNRKNYEIAEAMQEFAFLEQLKKEGKAVKIGFSFHDSADLLNEILTKHPEVDYVQLQINYLDWESSSIQSHRCYETAISHGKKVIVMEPVKGGTLASLPETAAAELKAFEPDMSIASHAFRFAQSLSGVKIVLSGMNEIDQLLDNLKDTLPPTQEHLSLLQKVAVKINSDTAIACTACGYCLAGCPKNIPIPSFFSMYNDLKRHPEDDWKIAPAYHDLSIRSARASECISCRKCEGRCPQKLPVPEWIKRVSDSFDK